MRARGGGAGAPGARGEAPDGGHALTKRSRGGRGRKSPRAVRAILRALEETYPAAQTALRYDTPYQLLVATILSAQCTDERVNRVTSVLFREHPDPASILGLGQDELEDYIRTCGLFRSKARNILAASRRLVDAFGGRVPDDREALMTLPGVGRKTANVVLTSVHRKPAIAVDTHVFRVSRRLGLARGDSPHGVEQELMEALPEPEWAATHHRLIFHGRAICRARRPLCEKCPLTRWCDWYADNVSDRIAPPEGRS